MKASEIISKSFDYNTVNFLEKILLSKIISGNGFPKRIEERKYYLPKAEKAIHRLLEEIENESSCSEAFKKPGAVEMWLNYFLEKYY